MLTRKVKYGLKALMHLARLREGEVAFLEDISRKRDIPKSFLTTIMQELRNGGFVISRAGRNGGHKLARPAGEIYIGSVIRTLDGSIAPMPCASERHYEPCPDCDPATCEVRRLMLDAREVLSNVFDRRTLAEMWAQSEVNRLLGLSLQD